MIVRNVIITVQAGLVLLAVWLSWRLVEQLRDAGGGPAPAVAAGRIETPDGDVHQKPSLQPYEIIARRNLFGAPAGTTTAESGIDVDALDQTALNLKLWGTVAGDDGAAYAIIEDPGLKKQAIFRVGDAVQNATVRMVLREKIVLSQDGKDEVLLMERSLRSGARDGPARAALRPGAQTQPESTASEPAPVQTIPVEEALRQALAIGPEQLPQHGMWEAVATDGRPDALKLTAPLGDSIFLKLGLQAGDVVLSIDDAVVGSIEDIAALLARLSNSGNGVVAIERSGNPLTLRYEHQTEGSVGN